MKQIMYYTDGNTVRQMPAMPANMPDYREERRRKEQEEREAELKRQKRIARKNQEKALRNSRRYVMFLSLGAVIFAVFAGAGTLFVLTFAVFIPEDAVKGIHIIGHDAVNAEGIDAFKILEISRHIIGIVGTLGKAHVLRKQIFSSHGIDLTPLLLFFGAVKGIFNQSRPVFKAALSGFQRGKKRLHRLIARCRFGNFCQVT